MTSKRRLAVSTATIMTIGSPSMDSVVMLYFHCHSTWFNPVTAYLLQQIQLIALCPEQLWGPIA
jgi:hypothetical protein